MESGINSVSRSLPFGAVVVWDALTDPVLLQGWLAPAATPVVDDALVIALDGVPMPAASSGSIRSIEPGRVAELDLGAAGSVRFVVEPTEALESGRSTCRCTAIAAPAHDLAARGAVAALEARLDALHELLRGRPAEWESSTGGPGVRA